MLPETVVRYPYLTVPEALDKLAALGDHHHIATHLAERGVKGACNNPTYCPIAQYLSKETGVQVEVGLHAAYTHKGAEATGLDWLPDPVSDFIAAFDSREHPELEMHLLDILRMDLAPKGGECA